MERAWYTKRLYTLLLLPFTVLYTLIVIIKKNLYHYHFLKQTQFDKPVIVIGNILIGGTGKTPLTIALAKALMDKGVRVGVVSRGYGGAHKQGSRWVQDHDSAEQVGDEPLLIRQSTQARVLINSNRIEGIRDCFAWGQVDAVICDDGLNCYALKPRYKIALHPNNVHYYPLCLPAGPLREPLSALTDCDCVVGDLSYRIEGVVDEKGLPVSMADLNERSLTAITAIARPQRFFTVLQGIGLNPPSRFFPDHHGFTPSDLEGISGALITTEKDWVKLKDLPLQQPCYIVKMAVDMPASLNQMIQSIIGALP